MLRVHYTSSRGLTPSLMMSYCRLNRYTKTLFKQCTSKRQVTFCWHWYPAHLLVFFRWNVVILRFYHASELNNYSQLWYHIISEVCGILESFLLIRLERYVPVLVSLSKPWGKSDYIFCSSHCFWMWFVC